jgi:hypothetical protein
MTHSIHAKWLAQNMAKEGVARSPVSKKSVGNAALRRVAKRQSYTEIYGIYGDGLIPGNQHYSIFFILCSINKKRKTFIFIDIYREKANSVF